MTIPSAVAKRFKGPKYGIEGIHKILGVEKRRCAQIIKPRWG